MSYRLKAFLSQLKNRYSFYKKNRNLEFDDEYSIHFVCGYHGLSGGSEAMVSVANQLSKSFKVFFYTFPKSSLNPLLGSFVQKSTKINKAKLFIVDRSLSDREYEIIKSYNVPVLVSIHGKPNSLHGLEKDASLKVFKYATHCHFVSTTQSELFQRNARNPFVIANSSDDLRSCNALRKKPSIKRLGLVGNFEAPRKNLEKTLEYGLETIADSIVVWGNVPKKINDDRIDYRGYGHNKVDIYKSFDAFVSLSVDENLPLAIIQALSAGKPCVLSDIPAHREFSVCKGVLLVDLSNKEQIVNAIDQILETAPDLQDLCERFWFENFSEEKISEKWKSKVTHLINEYRHFGVVGN